MPSFSSYSAFGGPADFGVYAAQFLLQIEEVAPLTGVFVGDEAATLSTLDFVPHLAAELAPNGLT